MPQQAGDEGVAPGLLEHALAGVDQDDREVGRRGAGDHVAGVLNVPGRVGDDELALGRGEVAVGHVDRDALLALGAQAVGQQRQVRRARRPGSRRWPRSPRADPRRCSWSRRADGRSAWTCRRRRSRRWRSAEDRADGPQKYPSFLRSSIAASDARSSARVAPRSVMRVARDLVDDLLERVGVRLDGAGAGHVADGAEADRFASDGSSPSITVTYGFTASHIPSRSKTSRSWAK